MGKSPSGAEFFLTSLWHHDYGMWCKFNKKNKKWKSIQSILLVGMEFKRVEKYIYIHFRQKKIGGKKEEKSIGMGLYQESLFKWRTKQRGYDVWTVIPCCDHCPILAGTTVKLM